MPTTGTRVRLARETLGWRQSDLAKAAGVSPSLVSKIERDDHSKVAVDTIAWIAHGLGKPVRELVVKVPEWRIKELEAIQASLSGGGRNLPVSAPEQAALIPEYDVRVGAGGGGIVSTDWASREGGAYEVERVTSHWSIPESYLRSELKVSASTSAIFEVLGDSMSPTLESGDRVIVDWSHTMPTPDGIYVIHDGYGMAVKRLQLMRPGDGVVVRVISDNPSHTPWDMEIGEGHQGRILGRVVGKISRL